MEVWKHWGVICKMKRNASNKKFSRSRAGEEWLVLLLYSKKQADVTDGLSVLHILLVCVGVSSRYSGFRPESKTCRIRLNHLNWSKVRVWVWVFFFFFSVRDPVVHERAVHSLHRPHLTLPSPSATLKRKKSCRRWIKYIYISKIRRKETFFFRDFPPSVNIHIKSLRMTSSNIKYTWICLSTLQKQYFGNNTDGKTKVWIIQCLTRR